MTSKTSPAAGRTSRSNASGLEKAAIRWLLILIACEAPALSCHSLPLAVLGIVAFAALAVWRMRKAHRRWRAGGKSAMRHRARFQGHATLAEIRRNLSRGQGVPIGTVRSTR